MYVTPLLDMPLLFDCPFGSWPHLFQTPLPPPSQESLEFRMHLRHEFLELGILPVINQLQALNIAQLNK